MKPINIAWCDFGCVFPIPGRRCGAMALVLLGAIAAPAVPIVSNVQLRQIEGTKLVRITYDVADDVNTQLWASVSVSTNGVALPSRSVTGDVAVAMSPGRGKSIVWDAGADWNGRYTEIAEAVVDVVAGERDPESICIDCKLVFSSSGSANWITDREVFSSANVSMRSGAISHSQTTSLKTTVTGSGTLSFKWKVSSESNYDKLHLYVDGSSVTAISGEVDWQDYTHTITGSSTHTVEWRYAKDTSASNGSDCGWIDDVCWSSN